MAAISIQPGIIPQCKDLTHGAIAAAVVSHLIKGLLKGADDSISLTDLATMTASKLEDVVTTCSELEGKGLLSKNVEGPWSGVSSIIPFSIQIKLAVSQMDLFGKVAITPPSPKNPLGLFLNHDYKRVDGGRMTFRGYEKRDGIYQFFSPQHGGLRGDESWVRSLFDLVDVPDWDAKLPQEEQGIEMPELSAEGLKIKRFSPERMAEIAALDASKTLARKNPTAKELAQFSDTNWAVTGVVGEGSERKIYVTPCTPAGADEKERVFKAGKNRWVLGDEAARIVLMEATVEEIVAAAPVDPEEFVRDLFARGFADDGVILLRPSSFEALWRKLWPEEEPDRTRNFSLENGPVITCDAVAGIEIDGYEEPALEQAAEPKIEIEDPTFHWEPEEYDDRGLVEVTYKRGYEKDTDLFVLSWDGGFVNHRVASAQIQDNENYGDIVHALVIALVPPVEERVAGEAAQDSGVDTEPEAEG